MVVCGGPLGTEGEGHQPEDDAEDLEPKDSPGVVEIRLLAQADGVIGENDQCCGRLGMLGLVKQGFANALTVKRVRPKAA
jgi:hypothetical protein